jgi:hypothetical protein
VDEPPNAGEEGFEGELLSLQAHGKTKPIKRRRSTRIFFIFPSKNFNHAWV